jgi:GMP synthase (glutamine-hydrolysing)
MKDDDLADSFDRALLRPLEKAGKEETTFFRVPREKQIPDLSGYSHIIISGSESSAIDDNPWDDLLLKIVHAIMHRRKPLLGICYGHQFIARAVGGKHCVRRSEHPEFGWADIQLTEDPLFAGVTTPSLLSMVSHYDEVYNLPGGFKILASNTCCAVHAFQFKDLPVWGIQFHPEYNIEEANEIFQLVSLSDPTFCKHAARDVLPDETQLRDNERIIRNFLETSAPKPGKGR